MVKDNILGESKRSYAHPLIVLPDPADSNETVWILKKPLLLDTYDVSNPQDWREHLAGEPIKVRKTVFALSEKEEKTGIYAYWVGDDGGRGLLERYTPQLQTYVDAVQAMLHLPVGSVTARLLCTGPGIDLQLT